MSYSANRTRISVVYGPARPKAQSILQITIRFGKNPNEAEHLARQSFLAALKRYQEVLAGEAPGDT